MVQQIGNYTVADLTNMYNKYILHTDIFLELLAAIIYTYLYSLMFHLCHSVNIYSNWLREQFCTLSLNVLYIFSLQ